MDLASHGSRRVGGPSEAAAPTTPSLRAAVRDRCLVPRSPCAIPLILLAALGLSPSCSSQESGANDGGAPVLDGGPPDGGPPTGIARLDWRDARGTPLRSRSLGVESDARIVAALPSEMVTVSACGDSGCRLDWIDGSGAARLTLENRTFLHGLPVSLDGKWLTALHQATSRLCTTNEVEYLTLGGDVELVELESGARYPLGASLESHVYSDPAFSEEGRWVRLHPLRAGECGTADTQFWSVDDPNERAPVDPIAFAYLRELSGGLWLGYGPGDDLGLVNPRVPGQFDTIALGVQAVHVEGGWVHGYSRWPVQEVASREIAGAAWRWAVPSTEELYPETSWGRWVLLCSRLSVDGTRYPCRVHDMRGTFPDRLFEASALPRRRLALLGAIDQLLYIGPWEGGHAAFRLDLKTGASDRMAQGAATFHPLGDGAAALVLDDERRALLVQGGAPELLAEDVQQIVSLPESSLARRTIPQARLAFVIRRSAANDAASLDLFDLVTRRLVSLTDRLAYNPTPGEPFASDGCGLPWVARVAGDPAASSAIASETIFFLEYPIPGEGADSTLWLMPADLSTPPRALWKMHYSYCRAPLVSADGRHAVVAPQRFDGRFEIVSAEGVAAGH